MSQGYQRKHYHRGDTIEVKNSWYTWYYQIRSTNETRMPEKYAIDETLG